MDPRSGNTPTRSNQWGEIEYYVGRFEAAMQSGAAADLRQFLPTAESPLRSRVLKELLQSDLEARWRRGQPVQLEYYLTEFPELGGAGALDAGVIYEEYRARHMFGDKPLLADYRARFPAQFADLEKIVQNQPIPSAATAAFTPAPAPKIVASRSKMDSMMGSGVAFMQSLGYEFVRRLGKGTYGEVFQGKAPGGVPVAIKVMLHKLDQAEAQRELHSLELIRELRHPFLVSTQSFFIHDEELCIVMELADKSLRDRLKECKRSGQKGMSKRELLRYMEQAADALDFLHERDLQHRDIKPDNILIMSGFAKVADFGLARIMPQDETMHKTLGGGTPVYMPPEAWRGTVHKHSDQYSLAATYVELRRGTPLFATADFMELARRHCEDTPDLSGLEKEEQRVLSRALAKNPHQRFESCAKFIEALGGGGGITGVTAPGDISIIPSAKGNGPRLLQRLGGRQGEVWEAEIPGAKDKMTVTVHKNLTYAATRDLIRNLRLLKDIEHSHLLKVHSYYVVDARGALLPENFPDNPDKGARLTMMVAAELTGDSLEQRLDRCVRETGQAMPVAEIMKYLWAVAEALDQLKEVPHQLDDQSFYVRHGSVCPGNIVTVGGEVKLAGLASAYVVQSDPASVRAGDRDLYVAFAAPELLIKSQISSASDQCSLALAYFHLRSANLPFSGAMTAEQIMQVHNGKKLDFSALPEMEQKILTKATALDPDERYVNCQVMVSNLEEATRDQPPLAASELIALIQTRPPDSGVPSSSFDMQLSAAPPSQSVAGQTLATVAPAYATPVPQASSGPAVVSPPMPLLRPGPGRPITVAPQAAPDIAAEAQPTPTGDQFGTLASPARPQHPKSDPSLLPPAAETKRPKSDPWAVPGVVEPAAPQPEARPAAPAPPAAQRPSPPPASQGKPKPPSPAAETGDQFQSMPAGAPALFATGRPARSPTQELRPPSPAAETGDQFQSMLAGAPSAFATGRPKKSPTQEMIPPPEIAQPIARPGWKDKEKEPRHSGRPSGSWKRAAAVIAAVALLVGAGFGAWMIFGRSPTVTDKGDDSAKKQLADLSTEADKLIASGKWQDAHALAGKMDQISLEEAKDAAQKKRDAALGKGESLLKQKLVEASNLDKERWREAYDLAADLEQEFRLVPGSADKTEALRRNAIDKGKSLLQDQIKRARAEKMPQGVAVFREAYRLGKEVDVKGPGSRQTGAVVDAWIDYTKSLPKREERLESVNELLIVEPKNEIALQIKADAEKAPTSEFEKLVDKLGTTIDDKSFSDAVKTVKELAPRLASMPPQKRLESQKQLADRVLGPVLRQAFAAKSGKAILDLVTELETLQLQHGKFELTLAKALAHLPNYTQFLSNYADAEKLAAGDQSKDLDSALAKAAGDAADDESLKPVERKAVLDKLVAVIANKPMMKAEKLADGLNELVNRLVKDRYEKLGRAEEYEELLPYCAASFHTNKAKQLVLACYAECLLLHADVQLKKPRSMEDENAARIALSAASPDKEPKHASYIYFALGLEKQGKAEWAEAVANYEKAFSDLDKSWQTPGRKKLAASAFYETGKKAVPLRDGYDQFRFAYELYQPELPPYEYRIKLLESAADDSERKFGQSLEDCTKGDGAGAWPKEHALELASVFVAWAEKTKTRKAGQQQKWYPSSALFKIIMPALALTAEVPRTKVTNFWMGYALFSQNKKEESIEYFAKALLDLKELNDVVCLRIKTEILSVDEMLTALNRAVASLPKKREQTHAYLLIWRAWGIYNDKVALNADLARPKPQCLADLDEMLELNKALEIRGEANTLTINLHNEARIDAGVPAATKEEFKNRANAAERDLEDLLLQDGIYRVWKQNALKWADVFVKKYTDRMPDEDRARRFRDMKKKHSSNSSGSSYQSVRRHVAV
jgi:serine/threonine protein kinase